jgi:hypothetical protein
MDINTIETGYHVVIAAVLNSRGTKVAEQNAWSTNPIHVRGITRAEAAYFLDGYVQAVADHPQAAVARSLTSTALRQLFGLPLDPGLLAAEGDEPATLRGCRLVGLQPVPMGFMAVFHVEDPPEGFPQTFGLVLGIMEIQAVQNRPNDWPEYRVESNPPEA